MSQSKYPENSSETFSLEDVEELPNLCVERPNSCDHNIEDPKPLIEGNMLDSLTAKFFIPIPDESPRPQGLLPPHANPASTIFEDDLNILKNTR